MATKTSRRSNSARKNLTVRPILTNSDLDCFITQDPRLMRGAQQLRYDIFISQLNWLPQNAAGLDTDEYDQAKHATQIVLTSKSNEVVGTARVLSGSGAFMLNREFSVLDPQKKCKNGPDTCEISRLCLSAKLPAATRSYAALLLYKTLYRFCISRGHDLWYIVVTLPYLQSLQKLGFPFQLITKSTSFGDHSPVALASLDCAMARQVLSHSNPGLYHWITGHDDMKAGNAAGSAALGSGIVRNFARPAALTATAPPRFGEANDEDT